jgi:hypothetical protein
VRSAQERVRTVSGEARVYVETKAFTGSIRQFIAAEKPDRLHLETLDFFGNVAAVLAAGDGRFALYDAKERVLYRGAATPANLARLVPIPLAAADLVTILCGSAPLLAGEPRSAEPGNGFVALEIAGATRTQTVRVVEGAAVSRSELRRGGALAPGLYDLVFGSFHARAGARFPDETRLLAESPRVRLDLAWSDVEVNGALDPALFRIEPPKGARIVELDRVPDASPPSVFEAPGASDGGTPAPPGGETPPRAPPGD